jgi:hypothetical protein
MEVGHVGMRLPLDGSMVFAQGRDVKVVEVDSTCRAGCGTSIMRMQLLGTSAASGSATWHGTAWPRCRRWSTLSSAWSSGASCWN